MHALQLAHAARAEQAQAEAAREAASAQLAHVQSKHQQVLRIIRNTDTLMRVNARVKATNQELLQQQRVLEADRCRLLQEVALLRAQVGLAQPLAQQGLQTTGPSHEQLLLLVKQQGLQLQQEASLPMQDAGQAPQPKQDSGSTGSSVTFLGSWAGAEGPLPVQLPMVLLVPALPQPATCQQNP